MTRYGLSCVVFNSLDIPTSVEEGTSVTLLQLRKLKNKKNSITFLMLVSKGA